MKRSEKKYVNPNEITVSIKGALPTSSSPEETEYWNALKQGVKCRGFLLYCAIDSPDSRAPGFVISHKVELEEVAGLIMQDTYLNAAATCLAQGGAFNPKEDRKEGVND